MRSAGARCGGTWATWAAKQRGRHVSVLCGVHVRRRVGEQQPQALARSRAPRLENYDPLLLLRPLPLQMIIITDTSLLLLLLRLLLLLLLLPLVVLLRLLRLLPILLLLILLLQLTITRNPTGL